MSYFQGHPRQWGRARKTYDTCMIVFLEFYTYTPVAAHTYRDIGISPVLATFIFVSTCDGLPFPIILS
ncbi:mfs multidrug transporter [Colletotrichum incanum]|uniref:Mfs multidrug transporter n=1 Tax=Colletotrichum incanum TaxID=1573173 RepID=A0A162P1R5_COLIC|nr:mfs multidrug transporter [Colletotrichum incanum]